MIRERSDFQTQTMSVRQSLSKGMILAKSTATPRVEKIQRLISD